MKYVQFILLLAAICIETTFIQFPLTLMFVILFSMTQGLAAAVSISIAGLLYDLFASRPLGSTSLFFLCVSWIISKYQRKLYLSGVALPLVFVAVLSICYGLIFTSRIDPLQIVLSVIVSACCLFVMNRYIPEFDTPVKRNR